LTNRRIAEARYTEPKALPVSLEEMLAKIEEALKKGAVNVEQVKEFYTRVKSCHDQALTERDISENSTKIQEQKQKKDELDKKLSSIQKHRNNILKCLEDRIDQRESDAALTSTLDSLYADTAAKRSAASAPRGGEAKKQRVERQDTGPTSWVREWMMDRLCDAHSPGVLDETERDEIMAENERLEGPWDDFWAAVKKAGWTQPEFIRGKRQVKTLADKPRVELVDSASSTPTTRAGVDDDGSDSD
jgi:hypothetical protein